MLSQNTIGFRFCVDVASFPFHLGGGVGAVTRRLKGNSVLGSFLHQVYVTYSHSHLFNKFLLISSCDKEALFTLYIIEFANT